MPLMMFFMFVCTAVVVVSFVVLYREKTKETTRAALAVFFIATAAQIASLSVGLMYYRQLDRLTTIQNRHSDMSGISTTSLIDPDSDSIHDLRVNFGNHVSPVELHNSPLLKIVVVNSKHHFYYKEAGGILPTHIEVYVSEDLVNFPTDIVDNGYDKSDYFKQKKMGRQVPL